MLMCGTPAGRSPRARRTARRRSFHSSGTMSGSRASASAAAHCAVVRPTVPNSSPTVDTSSTPNAIAADSATAPNRRTLAPARQNGPSPRTVKTNSSRPTTSVVNAIVWPTTWLVSEPIRKEAKIATPIAAPPTTIRARTRSSRPSAGGRGGRAMTVRSGGSTPSAAAGRPSSSRLTSRIWSTVSGAPSPSSTARAKASTSPALPANRKCAKRTMLSWIARPWRMARTIVE